MGAECYDVVCFIPSIIQGLRTGGTYAVICVVIRQLQFDGQFLHECFKRIMSHGNSVIPLRIDEVDDIFSAFLPEFLAVWVEFFQVQLKGSNRAATRPVLNGES